MSERKTAEQAEQFNALLRQAFMLETQELDVFLEQVEDADLRQQISYIVKTADPSTALMFKTGIAGDSVKLNNSEPFQLLPGEKVGRFRVEKVIAQGGMGLVYKGYDELLGRHVAIKTIRPDFAFKPATQQRFIREAQILSKINDGRICQIYDFIEQNNCEFIVLEYIDGNNLNDSKKPLKPIEKLQLFVQLAEALENAHQQGIIHRDLKPDNLMVTSEPSLKILDFGIARSASYDSKSHTQLHETNHSLKDDANNLTVAGSIMGTVRYMSPEQIRGQQVTSSSDMYSVGVILQETLTNEIAYELNDTNELKNQVASAQLIKPKGLDSSLQSIINDLTQLDPQQRLSASELKQRIQHYLEKPLRLRKNILFFFLVCLMLVAGWFWYFRYEEASKTQVFNDFLIEAETLGNRLNQIYTLPIHDITPEVEANQIRTADLIEQIKDEPLLDEGSKHYLQAIVYKNVNDFYSALNFFEQSLEQGFNNAQLVHQMAETAIFVWWNAEANGFLTARPAVEVAAYKQQAYEYAQLSQATGKLINSLSKAYLLWRSNKFEEALTMVDRVLESADWQYSGYLLKAAIYMQKMFVLDTGLSSEERLQMGLDAIKAYELAAERARSHPDTYMGICFMNKTVIREALTNSGFEVEPYFNKGIRACEQALLVDPNNAYVRSILAAIYVTYSEVQLQKGKDISELLDLAQKWTEQDIAYFPKDSSYLNKAEIHSKKAQINNRKGIDPQPQIKLAVEAYKKAGELNPNTLGDNTIGALYNLEILAQYQLARGVDVSTTFIEAQNVFKRYYQAEISRHQTHLVVVHMNTAAIYYVYAKYLLLIKEPIDDVVEEGLKILNQHPKVFENESFIFGIKAQLLSALVKQKLNQSQEATNELVLLHENIDRSLSLFPNQNELLLIKANGLFYEIQNDVAKKEVPHIHSNLAKQYYQKSIEANSGYAPAYVDFGRFLLFLAEPGSNKETKNTTVFEAIELFEKAIQSNSNYAEAYMAKADALFMIGGKSKEISLLRENAVTLNPLLAKSN